MAEIIRPNQQNLQSNVQASLSDAASTASGGVSIGQVSRNLGAGIVSTSAGDQIRAFGEAAVQQGLAELSKAKASVDAGIFSKKMNEAVLEYNTAIQSRSSQVYDDQGNPLFTTLVQDTGDLGRKVLDKYSQTIMDPSVKDKFVQSFSDSISEMQIRTLGVAKQQQLEFSNVQYGQFKQLNQNQATVDDLSLLPSYSGRLQEVLQGRVAAGEMSAEQARQEIDLFNKDVRMSHYTNSINTNPTAFKEILTNNPDSLQLDAQTIDSLKHKTDAAIAKQDQQLRATKQAMIEQYGFLYQNAADLMVQGKEVPPELLTYIQDISKGTPLEQDTNKLVAQQDIINIFSAKSPAERSRVLSELDKTTITDPNLAGIQGTLSQVNDNLNTQIRQDPVSFMREKGLVPEDASLDFSQPLGDQLAKLAQQGAVVKAYTGLDSLGLTSQEETALVQFMNSQSSVEKANTIASLQNSLGSDKLSTLLGKYKQKDPGSLIPFVGTLQGQPDVQKAILDGQARIDSKQAIMPEAKDIIKEAVKYIPDYSNEQQRQDVLNAVVAMYANQSNSDTSVKSSLVKELVNKAAMGGVIEYNGVNIEPSRYGQTEAQFRTMLSNISTQHIDKLGGVGNYDGDVNQLLQNAWLKNEGRGVYSVRPQGVNEPSVLLDKQGNLFLIDVDKVMSNNPGIDYNAFSGADVPTDILDKLGASTPGVDMKTLETKPFHTSIIKGKK